MAATTTSPSTMETLAVQLTTTKAARIPTLAAQETLTLTLAIQTLVQIQELVTIKAQAASPTTTTRK